MAVYAACCCGAAGLMSNAAQLCVYLTAGTLALGKALVGAAAEAEFMEAAAEAARAGEPPPLPAGFGVHWRHRFGAEWAITFRMFGVGVPLSLARSRPLRPRRQPTHARRGSRDRPQSAVVLAGWLKYAYSSATTWALTAACVAALFG